MHVADPRDHQADGDGHQQPVAAEQIDGEPSGRPELDQVLGLVGVVRHQEGDREHADPVRVVERQCRGADRQRDQRRPDQLERHPATGRTRWARAEQPRAQGLERDPDRRDQQEQVGVHGAGVQVRSDHRHRHRPREAPSASACVRLLQDRGDREQHQRHREVREDQRTLDEAERGRRGARDHQRRAEGHRAREEAAHRDERHEPGRDHDGGLHEDHALDREAPPHELEQHRRGPLVEQPRVIRVGVREHVGARHLAEREHRAARGEVEAEVGVLRLAEAERPHGDRDGEASKPGRPGLRRVHRRR